KAYRQYRGKTSAELVDQVLGQQHDSARKLAMLYLAWHDDATPETLSSWLKSQNLKETFDAERLYKSYDPHRLTLEDFAYLLNRHPLDVWCARQMSANPD